MSPLSVPTITRTPRTPARAEAVPIDSTNDGGSQTLRAQVQLRDLILAGEIAPGTRVTEQALVDKLGVSRTPIRAALMRLADEGLVAALPAGGFAVQTFTESAIHDAIEIRGTLEGLAARLAAERGVKPVALSAVKAVLAQLDEVVRGDLSEAAFSRYIELNAGFHAHVVELAGSDLLAWQIERVSSLSFASPSAFVRIQASVPEGRESFVLAQAQHRLVLEAIENREGARAEALMREHARIAHGNLRLALTDADRLSGLLPGVGLIRRGAR